MSADTIRKEPKSVEFMVKIVELLFEMYDITVIDKCPECGELTISKHNQLDPYLCAHCLTEFILIQKEEEDK